MGAQTWFFFLQFIDLCILLGCDYCDKIPGLGPKRALTLIQKHRTIENVVLHVKRKVLDRHMALFLCLCAALQENCMSWWDTRICCPSDPSCTTSVEIQRSTKDIPGCTTNRSSRAHLDWAGRRSIGCLPLSHQTCSVCTFNCHSAFLFPGLVQRVMTVFMLVYFLERAGSVIGWRHFVRRGTVNGKREKRSEQRDAAGRLTWRTSLEWPERGVWWVKQIKSLINCHFL